MAEDEKQAERQKMENEQFLKELKEFYRTVSIEQQEPLNSTLTKARIEDFATIVIQLRNRYLKTVIDIAENGVKFDKVKELKQNRLLYEECNTAYEEVLDLVKKNYIATGLLSDGDK